MTIEPEDILKLDEILKPCVELTSLSLTLYTTHGTIFLRQNLAKDVSLLIGHHPTVKRLVLCKFEDLIVGYEDKYPLPTSLETLVLSDSILTSTTPHIRDLMISNTCCGCQSDMERCLRFVESQAETLVSLHIDLSMNGQQPTVDRLKRMTKRLAEFNKLQRFMYRVQNLHDILEILIDVMPLIAINQSLNSYSLDSYLWTYDREFLQALQLAMKTTCIGRRRLLDFATVIFHVDEEFQDGFPIVEYEDLWEVVGYRFHLPEDYDCEDNMDDVLYDGIPFVEYEDVCEMVGYQCHLPDNYYCKRDMDEDIEDGIPIGEYEDKCEVVGYKCHFPDDYDCEHDLDGIPIGEYEEVCAGPCRGLWGPMPRNILGASGNLKTIKLLINHDCEHDLDDIPIGEYKEVCEVVGYQCHLPDVYACDMDEDDGCDQRLLINALRYATYKRQTLNLFRNVVVLKWHVSKTQMSMSLGLNLILLSLLFCAS